eukprot:TRINITY_DN100_c0_g1_i4.p1 TRINITY_DN100_c0_g1~~TRINITY_DN100_c0_g1_i4.p1  ORF type:complete len:248 (-),score=9.57 TRINITY_DN100_c0_g1_i4:331-1074(-)
MDGQTFMGTEIQVQTPKPKRSERGGPGRGCFTCGREGHIAAECPNRGSAYSRRSRSRSPHARGRSPGASRVHSFTRGRSPPRGRSPIRDTRDRGYDRHVPTRGHYSPVRDYPASYDYPRYDHRAPAPRDYAPPAPRDGYRDSGFRGRSRSPKKHYSPLRDRYAAPVYRDSVRPISPAVPPAPYPSRGYAPAPRTRSPPPPRARSPRGRSPGRFASPPRHYDARARSPPRTRSPGRDPRRPSPPRYRR